MRFFVFLVICLMQIGQAHAGMNQRLETICKVLGFACGQISCGLAPAAKVEILSSLNLELGREVQKISEDLYYASRNHAFDSEQYQRVRAQIKDLENNASLRSQVNNIEARSAYNDLKKNADELVKQIEVQKNKIGSEPAEARQKVDDAYALTKQLGDELQLTSWLLGFAEQKKTQVTFTVMDVKWLQIDAPQNFRASKEYLRKSNLFAAVALLADSAFREFELNDQNLERPATYKVVFETINPNERVLVVKKASEAKIRKLDEILGRWSGVDGNNMIPTYKLELADNQLPSEKMQAILNILFSEI